MAAICNNEEVIDVNMNESTQSIALNILHLPNNVHLITQITQKIQR